MGGGAWDSARGRPRGPPRLLQGYQDLESATPEEPPLAEGALDSKRAPQARQAGPPAAGGRAHDSPTLALPLSPARGHPVLHKPLRPGRPFCTHRRRSGLLGDAASSPAFLFTFFFFFFCLWKREECSILPYLCFYSGTNGSVCVSLCWFFKEMGRKTPFSPFPALAPPPPPHPVRPHRCPSPFCCFVLLRALHIPVCNPWFSRFSVFSKVSLCQLGSLPSSLAGACWAGPPPFPLPPPLLGRGRHIWRAASAT